MLIGVVGLGKLGLPLALLLREATVTSPDVGVRGYDRDPNVVVQLAAGHAHISEPGVQDLLGRHGLFTSTDLEEAGRTCRVIFVVVPSPSLPNGRFDPTYVAEAAEAVGRGLAQAPDVDQTVVICSTLMPGDTELVVKKRLEAAAGRKVHVVYSPEFIALGNVIDDMRNPDVVLIGRSSLLAGGLVEAIMEMVWKDEPHVAHMAIVDAELAKITVNAYVTTKISFANVVSELAENIGADAHVILDAIGHDKRIGNAYFRPGGAFGGPCFPRDTDAYQALIDGLGLDADFAAETGRVNDHQAERVARRVYHHIMNGNVAIMGVAYKPGTPIVERSFGLAIADLLRVRFPIHYWDPLARVTPRGETISVDPDEALLNASLAIIATPHPELLNVNFPCPVIDCWGGSVTPSLVRGDITTLGKGHK